MSNRILVLKAYRNSDESHEYYGICEQAQLYGIEPTCKCVQDNKELEKILNTNRLFDNIYLCAHGCSEGFACEDVNVNIGWKRPAMLLYHSKCINDDNILDKV